ncbi:hypothetical protein ABLE91_12490 [Aquabacter sp. CN5-332]|uniref:hypothetical protein n=1 Tax=Aquabacter sp. CN5-332 TaxID=3156608 RepID=UPI0032B60006
MRSFIATFLHYEMTISQYQNWPMAQGEKALFAVRIGAIAQRNPYVSWCGAPSHALLLLSSPPILTDVPVL